MTNPQPMQNSDGMLAQILLKQGEMGTQLAVISEQLKSLPDHESRIRTLETSRAKIMGAALAVSAISSAAGTWAGVLITHH